MFKTLQQLKDSISSIIRNATLQAPVSRANLSGLLNDMADTMFEISKYGSVFYFAHQDTGLADGSSWQNAKAFTVEAYNAVADNTACLFLGDGTKKYILSSTLNVVSGKPVYGGFAGIGMLNFYSKLTYSNDDWSLIKFSNFATIFEGSSDIKILNTGNIFNIVLGNCSITGNGGGIYNTGNVYNCTVTNCSATGDCGGIYNTGNVYNCTVTNCISNGYGGGIYNKGNVSNCTLTNCNSRYGGGGIFNYGSTSTNCTVTNCSSTNGGGIYNNSSNDISTNCTVTNCSATNGGGIYNTGNVSNCTVTNCSATGYAGGIYNVGPGTSTNCTVTECSASNGGGIYSQVEGASDESTIVSCYAPANPASNFLTGLKNYWNNTITQESRVS